MNPNRHTTGAAFAAAACLCVLGVILTAGLWPFHVPANQVKWLRDSDGLEFGPHGSAISLGFIRPRGLINSLATLEVWLEPAHSEASGTILAFDASAHPGEPFSLHQVRDALVIRRNNVDPQGISRTELFDLDRVFHQGTPVFLTVCLDGAGTSVYLNGEFSKGSYLSGTWNDLTGRLVLANLPTNNDSWSGTIRGLAIYQQKLTAWQIAAGYRDWTERRKVMFAAGQGADALYMFDERGGRVVHNRSGGGANLIIPAHYFILHPEFLRLPWKGYHPKWSYWQDIALNIAGFVPLGFCACASLSLIRFRHPGIAALVLGLLASLVIELIQTLLPTRLSDLTDVITNTLGTAIGVTMWYAGSESRQTLAGHTRDQSCRSTIVVSPP